MKETKIIKLGRWVGNTLAIADHKIPSSVRKGATLVAEIGIDAAIPSVLKPIKKDVVRQAAASTIKKVVEKIRNKD